MTVLRARRSATPSELELEEEARIARLVAEREHLLGNGTGAKAVPNDPASARFRFFDDLEVESLPQPEWLVKDMIPLNALAEIHGPPAGGKSFLALDLAMSVASGQDFHGRAVKRGPVLYVAAEGSAGLAARVIAWKKSREFYGRAGVYFVAEPVQLLDDASVAAFLAAFLAPGALEGYLRLIVIDTLARCLVGGEENSAKDVGLAIEALDRVRRVSGATVLPVHHTRKDDSQVERGSTALRGAMDTMIALKKEDSALTLTCDKQKDSAPFAPLRLELVPVEDSCALITAESQSAVTAGFVSSKQREALAILHSCSLEEGLATTVWLKASGLKDRTFYEARKALVAWGYVDCVGRGRNKLNVVAAKGHEVITANCNLTAE